ncbi:hypothetical protein GGR50DRAFT_669293 [Xylaria sp. CBS 124048]|nr:hypothetical protein GGR50DRAFT_669293 [Xylaria sp. CBS 124048]
MLTSLWSATFLHLQKTCTLCRTKPTMFCMDTGRPGIPIVIPVLSCKSLTKQGWFRFPYAPAYRVRSSNCQQCGSLPFIRFRLRGHRRFVGMYRLYGLSDVWVIHTDYGRPLPVYRVHLSTPQTFGSAVEAVAKCV